MEGPLRIGDTFLGKYEVHAEIGRGGHAVVYQAVHTHLRRHLALKILHRRGGLTEEMLQRGLQEASLLGQFNHPNIVQVHDAGIDAGHLYLIMELLRGRVLRDVLRQFGRLEVLELLALVEGVAEGLAVAHEADVVHRDLKPENIFLTTDNVPKILDFGIAKAVGSNLQTHHNVVLGTPGYMAPEQILGRKATPRSDLHALGLILYEAAAGTHPLLMDLTKRPHKQELIRMQVEKVPPRLDAVIPSFPRYVARLAVSLLSKDPAARPASARQVVELVREYRARYLEEHPDAPAPRDFAASSSMSSAEHLLPSIAPPTRTHPPQEASVSVPGDLTTVADDAAARAARAAHPGTTEEHRSTLPGGVAPSSPEPRPSAPERAQQPPAPSPQAAARSGDRGETPSRSSQEQRLPIDPARLQAAFAARSKDAGNSPSTSSTTWQRPGPEARTGIRPLPLTVAVALAGAAVGLAAVFLLPSAPDSAPPEAEAPIVILERRTAAPPTEATEPRPAPAPSPPVPVPSPPAPPDPGIESSPSSEEEPMAADSPQPTEQPPQPTAAPAPLAPKTSAVRRPPAQSQDAGLQRLKTGVQMVQEELQRERRTQQAGGGR